MRRGDIYYISPGPVIGSEQGGLRTCIIVSNEANNRYSQTVSVVYTTTEDKAELPTHVVIESAPKPCIALCEHVHTKSKIRLKDYVGHVTDMEMKQVENAVALGLNLNNIEQNYRKFISGFRKQEKRKDDEMESLKKENQGLMEKYVSAKEQAEKMREEIQSLEKELEEASSKTKSMADCLKKKDRELKRIRIKQQKEGLRHAGHNSWAFKPGRHKDEQKW